MFNLQVIAHLFFVLLFGCQTAYGQEVKVYPYNTIFNKQIKYTYHGDGDRTPAFVSVDNMVVFETQRGSNGDYEHQSLAGIPNSHNPAQVGNLGGEKRCLRWVIQSGWAENKKYYVIDFTQPQSMVVGPFRVPGDSDEVKAVYWGKSWATIKFKSLRSFKYYYKERTVVED